jgi:hypothetical protein
MLPTCYQHATNMLSKLIYSLFSGHTIEAYLNSLFCRLAEDNIGYVDWEPYLPGEANDQADMKTRNG